MRVGVVKEIKPAERRVGLDPSGAKALAGEGHRILVETGAGAGAGHRDADYEAAGAVVAAADRVWAESELLVKVKEPVAEEYPYLHAGQTLFTYLHLAADRPLTEALLRSGTTAIAYETVQDHTGLPLLAPMSEVAGRLAGQAAAMYLQAPFGGAGILMGGVPGVRPARVVVIGGGVVGTQAALMSLGLRAEVTVLDTSPSRIRQLEELFSGRVRVLMNDPHTLEAELADADAVIGAVLVPGAAAPKVIRREHLRLLKPHSLLVDVAIDQGGCFETSHPTTYDDPVFEVDGIQHYCVANMPGAVPWTSTKALINATLPYVQRLARLGTDEALRSDAALARGLNVADGRIAHPGVAAAFRDLPASLRQLSAAG
ncbi:alanine dehydrogenase [Tersicoccus solisilvae]|uniref:Alanine dehydrogenase n=1 Tax=Tersicoccus solisilvae TaxID=1882339 RepID=A0ABQ1PAW5_9MICC|nr:alanine dehydrogenase [Tersicoccus solisilvae]GGC90711.1 alanine dehydrogenase [Tersicoccus solisilvae]